MEEEWIRWLREAVAALVKRGLALGEDGLPETMDLEFKGNNKTLQDPLDRELWNAIQFARSEAVQSSLICHFCQLHHKNGHPKTVDRIEEGDIPCDECREFHVHDHRHMDCLAVQCVDEVEEAVRRFKGLS